MNRLEQIAREWALAVDGEDYWNQLQAALASKDVNLAKNAKNAMADWRAAVRHARLKSAQEILLQIISTKGIAHTASVTEAVNLADELLLRTSQ